MDNKISVYVITKNEEDKIARCLENLRWADEIVVVDSFSTDKTVTIAKKYTKKVFKSKFSGYGPQKQKAIDKCSNSWVLEVDSDEIITKELAQEIRQVISKPTSKAAFKIKRQEYFWDKPLMKSNIIRLYKKDKASYSQKEIVHEMLKVEGDIGQLRNIMHHEADKYRTITSWIKKVNGYTSKEVERARKEQRKMSYVGIMFRMIAKPLVYGLWLYLGKGLIFKGFRGLAWCILTGVYYILTYVKHFEEKINKEK